MNYTEIQSVAITALRSLVNSICLSSTWWVNCHTCSSCALTLHHNGKIKGFLCLLSHFLRIQEKMEKNDLIYICFFILTEEALIRFPLWYQVNLEFNCKFSHSQPAESCFPIEKAREKNLKGLILLRGPICNQTLEDVTKHTQWTTHWLCYVELIHWICG